MGLLGLGRSAEERDATARYTDLLTQIVEGRQPLHGLPDRVAEAARPANLSDRKLAKLHERSFRNLAERVLADDVLTLTEERELLGVGAALGLPNEDLQGRFPDLLIRLVIAGTNDGRLPVEPAPTVMTKPGETVHAEFGAALMKEVVRREYRGGSNGFSFKVMPGVYYRTGRTRGRSVVVGTELQVADSGVLAITSERVVFLGQRKTQESRYAKLVGLEVFTDGVRISVTNRQAASLFKLASGDLAAAIINRAAQNAGARG